MVMISRLKGQLYFPIAAYFAFWAKLKLARWHPRVVLITGSSGKTTLLHLAESQIGAQAHYSHHANSAYGIPFDILGFHQSTGSLGEWLRLAILAPFATLTPVRRQKLYVVEADSDRPGEAAFIAGLVRSEVTVWLSSDRSHSAAFDGEVAAGRAPNVETAIAQEYGNYIEQTSQLAIVNGDSQLIAPQLERTKAKVEPISSKTISDYKVTAGGAEFKVDGQAYTIPTLLPEEAGRSIAAVVAVCNYLEIPVDPTFPDFQLPPGRSSILRGIKDTTLIDSTYNAIPDAVRAILNLFNHLPGSPKWAVLGDMIEQGKSEQAEHERLAHEIAKLKLDRVILVGPRQSKYTAPLLKQLVGIDTLVAVCLEPKEVLDHLRREIRGGEFILFKAGSSFNLEGVVERLLADPEDAIKLCRRGPIWTRRRQKRGL